MRPSNKQRSRNKSGNNNHNQRRSVGNIINRVFESAGPDGKVRGTPQQIIEKYQALARDAQVAGDRVAAESFLQHSEHYSRMLGEAQRQMAEQRESQERSGDNNQQQRFDGQHGGQPRQDGPRFEGGSPEREQPRGGEQDGASSGMATIDPVESDDAAAGLIDTPENRARGQHSGEPERRRGGRSAEPTVDQVEGPAEAAETQPEPQADTSDVNGTEHAAAADEEPRKAPARRSRPRRTSRPAAGDDAAAPAEPVAE